MTEKKRYAEMIMKGASRSTISDLYRKKYKSEHPKRTFFAWKKEAKSLGEVKSTKSQAFTKIERVKFIKYKTAKKNPFQQKKSHFYFSRHDVR